MDLSSYLDQIRHEIDKTSLKKYSDQLYEKTGVAPEVLIMISIIVLSFMLFFGIFPNIICNLIAYLFPFYGTLYTIENKKFDKNWLIYWVLLGMISVMESAIHIILYWIPFYYPLKAVFLLWSMSTKYKGATLVYEKLLKERVKRSLETVDDAMQDVTVEKISQVVADAKEAIESSAKGKKSD